MILLPHAHAKLIEQAIKAAQLAGDLPAFEIPPIEAHPPKKAEQGDYASSIALQLAKPAGRSPLEVATIIERHLPSSEFVGSVEVVKPGFINFRLNETWLRQQINSMIAEGETLFQLEIGKDKRAQVEFVSANPSGPLTIGRSRGAIVGDSIARVLEAAGYTVQREYYFNNAGAQMVNLGNSLRIRYLEALGLPVEIPNKDDKTFYQGDYLIEFAKDMVKEHGSALVEEDWQPFKEYAEKRMFIWIKNTLERVNIRHDNFFNENSLYDSGAIWQICDALKARGYIYESAVREGADSEEAKKAKSLKPAVWFRSTTMGDDEDRVLVKSDGSPTYTLPDIAYHVNKIERGFDLLVNVLGADHGTQHKVVKYGVKALGLDPSPIHVVIVQMVRAVRDGKEVKMSTRQGVYDTLDDLIDLTSPDVVRYILLQRSPNSHLDFDLDLAVKQSNENPVYYIQNAHVRCAGIFREAQARGLSDEQADLSQLGEAELKFIRKALELGDHLEMAAVNLEPHKIAFYALELASIFHPIYDTVRALHGDIPLETAKARLRFYRAAQVVFKRLLTLMGMTAPDRM